MKSKQIHNYSMPYASQPTFHYNQYPLTQYQQHPQYPQQHRAGDWKCVICANINFAFRSQCNRCGLISKEQNDHQNTVIAYTGLQEHQTCGLPYFLTPLRKKDKENRPNDPSPDKESGIELNTTNNGGIGLLSVSPVLRQLGL